MQGIFISYSRVDEKYAKQMYDALVQRGFSPWLDKVSLLPGQRWESEIENAIRQANLVVLLLSKNAVDKRGYLQREIRFAIDIFQTIPAGNIYLIPARLDDCHVPETLAAIQWIDMFPDWDEGINKICESIYFQRTRESVSRPIEEQAPFPDDVTITQPAQGLNSKLAAFSGYWYGRWGEVLPSQLAIEQIDSNKARIVYTWGEHPSGSFKRGWSRVIAKVSPAGIIKFGIEVKFRFEIDENKDVIYGTRKEGQSTSRIVMKRRKL